MAAPAVLTDIDTKAASLILGSYRFDARVAAVARHVTTGAVLSRDRFFAVLNKLDVGDLVLHMKTDGEYEVRPGRHATRNGRRGQAHRV